MCMRYRDYTDKIKEYCDTYDLNFAKLNDMIKGSGENDIIFQVYNPEKGKMGLLDETPMPVVLIVSKLPDGSLKFEQTEHTRKYLS